MRSQSPPPSPPDDHLLDVRHQVVGDAHRVLAQLPARVRPDGVEVPQQQDAPLFIAGAEIAEHVLLSGSTTWEGQKELGDGFAYGQGVIQIRTLNGLKEKLILNPEDLAHTWKSLVRPYGEMAFRGVSSVIGVFSGMPYTVHEEENTICVSSVIYVIEKECQKCKEHVIYTYIKLEANR